MSLEQKLLGILIEPSHEKFTPYLYLDPHGHLIYGTGQDLGAVSDLHTLSNLKSLTIYQKGIELDTLKVENLFYDLGKFFDDHKVFDTVSKTYKIEQDDEFFRDSYGLFVNMDDSYSILKKDIKMAISNSRYLFGRFDTLPPKVQVAIALLTYRLGLGNCKRFIEIETNFKSYIEQRKWRDAGILIDKIKAWQDRRKRYACNLLN